MKTYYDCVQNKYISTSPGERKIGNPSNSDTSSGGVVIKLRALHCN